MEGTYKNITIEQAKQLLTQDATNIVDIRDIDSYHQGHIEGAVHLSDKNLQEFILCTDHDAPLLVCCYHGHSSQQAAQYLSAQGFEETYSIMGGYVAWQAQLDI